MKPAECALCGSTTGVSVGLVRYPDPPPFAGRPFESVPRCRDAIACRARVESRGEPWPIAEPDTPSAKSLGATTPAVTPLPLRGERRVRTFGSNLLKEP